MKNRTPDPMISKAASAVARAHLGGGDMVSAAPHVPIAILGFTRDPVARDFLAELAIEHGYGFRCAVDGNEAMRVLDAEPPGLIVVDIDAPDGRALVRALRADERWRGIPMLALTETNNPMIAVTIDAPVFFKPGLDGLDDAVTGRFDPPQDETVDMPAWPGRHPTA